MSQESLIEVAVDSNLSGTFTYLSPIKIDIGSRVVVPFGGQNRKQIGFVVGYADSDSGFKIKKITEIIDEKPIFSDTMMTLGRWLSDYYLHPLGGVLKSMLPASAKVKDRVVWSLTAAGEEAWKSPDSHLNQIVRAVFKRRGDLLDASFQKNVEKIPSELYPDGVRKLEKYLLDQGLVEKGSKTKLDKELQISGGSDLNGPQGSEERSLTEEQQVVFGAIQKEGIEKTPEKPFLLWGVTGAGKTEVYLQLIRSLFETHGPDKQALVLVPEISLTPQMTMVFESRFPGLVSVVHSALDTKERWRRLELIRNGERRILVGPRSAVFGPFKDLGMIIVDEEHDGSYKQSSGFQYNGRDVAVLRGRLEEAVVILGSATPSIESYSNGVAGKYRMLRMTKRVHQRGLPTVDLIRQHTRGRRGQEIRGALEDGDVPIHPSVIEKLKLALSNQQQSMVIVNRRGFAYFLMSREDRKPVSCPQCSVSLTVHKRRRLLKCHYCDYQESLSNYIGDNKNFLVVGYGSEQVESYLQKEVVGARVVRVDSDSVSGKGTLEDVLKRFRNQEIDILVGTQMLAKGHDFPNVTLICLLEVDQMLNLPDFRAGERTFQLMVQASGRAGRAELEGEVLLQTQKPDDPVIVDAVSQDYESFANRELEFRKNHSFPPFTKMIHVEFNSRNLDALEGFVGKVTHQVHGLLARKPEIRNSVAVLGPTVPPIEMVRGRLRRSIILSSQNQKNLWLLANFLKTSCSRLPSDLRMRVDVDPQSIL